MSLYVNKGEASGTELLFEVLLKCVTNARQYNCNNDKSLNEIDVRIQPLNYRDCCIYDIV